MSRKTILLIAALGLLVGTHLAWATMTSAQAKTLAETAYHHPGSKKGAAALSKLEGAANAGTLVAQEWLGDLYQALHHYAKGNYWYKKAAEQGSASAENDLGFDYNYGDGVPKNYTKANYWYRKAAEQGDVDAQYNLGQDYDHGEGVPKNYTKANYWYRKAAEQGDADAQLHLGLEYNNGDGVPKNYTKADYWYRKAAKQGDAVAEFNLGVHYNYGRGLPKNYVKANYWYRKAAKQGAIYAQYNLGQDYDHGEGVPKNYATANYWYKKAAEQGYADAELNLGFDYYNSKGITQDTARAIYWWKKAAAQGNSMAKKNLAIALAHEKHAKEQADSPLKLFGVGLKGASRNDIEPALVKAGLTPHNGHVGSKWWVDEYNVNGQLSGASELDIGYTQNDYFAIAEYTFPSSMDTGQVRRIISMVRTKYGQPSSVSGRYGLGPVAAVWNVGDGMEVKVHRGWPNTTTYLDLIDSRARAKMKDQLAMQKQHEQAQKAKEQSNAF